MPNKCQAFSRPPYSPNRPYNSFLASPYRSLQEFLNFWISGTLSYPCGGRILGFYKRIATLRMGIGNEALQRR
jgi:hypothetical protein